MERNIERPENGVQGKLEKSWESIPSYFLVVLFGYLFFLGYMTSLIDNAMPSVVSEVDAGANAFSEERAWKYLERIVGDGPRVAGTAYHLTKTRDLYDLVQEVTANATQEVRLDWQMVSGNYWLSYALPFNNAYRNASNIVALLVGDSGFESGNVTGSSILLNCHYDSRATSPGASDNALFCAAMVETLAILSKRETKLKHNVIFLFNGAEENPLHGSHGFLSHPWARGAAALVNLDSAGINCKSMLFQVTDPRVVSAYSRSVSRPSAQALGEALFSTGIVPSDTDFRIFRVFAGVYGIDLAFSKMGHVYHTRHDSLQVLQPGVLQHSGDMILALTKELADSDDFYNRTEPTTSVYWDYLNLFMLDYSLRTANIVDSLIMILGVASVLFYFWVVGFRKSQLKELLLCMASKCVCLGAGAAVLWMMTAIGVASTIQLRYLSNAWIVVPLYWMPYLIAAVATSQLYDAWRWEKSGLNRIRRVVQSMAATRSLMALVVVALLCVSGTATLRYVITVPLFLMSVVSFVSLTAVKFCRIKAAQHLILEVLMATPSLLFLLVVAIKINTLMLPIMGRSVTSKPDYLVAMLNMITVILAALPLSGIELLFSRIRLWTVMLSFSLVCIVICFVPLSPYRESDTYPALQRHSWYHSEIVSYDQNGVQTDRKTGIWFGRTEVNTPRNIPDLAMERGITFSNVKTDFESDCQEYTYCNLPMVTPRTINYEPNSMWIEFESLPLPAVPPSLTLRNRTCDGNICTLEFAFTGPPHLSLILHPYPNATLTSWSLSPFPLPSSTLQGRPVYFAFFARCTYSESYDAEVLSASFEVPNPDSTDPILDLSFNAHRISHNEEFSPALNNLINAMPDYFNVEAILSSRYNYVF